MPRARCPIVAERRVALVAFNLATKTLHEVVSDETGPCDAPLVGMDRLLGSCGLCRATGHDARPLSARRN